MDAPPGPLDGIRIVDLSRILAGPFCTQLLGDLGAEVIKIERPGTGDDTRAWGPPFAAGESAYFLSCNRNKKSVAIDLQKPRGRDLVRALVRKSDVLIENFRVGTMARWGLDYDSLAAEHPGLVYCSISAYGQDSCDASAPGYDFVIQARGGLMSITGPEEGPPYKVGVAITDLTAGLYAATAILAALYERGKSGRGQYIDIALLDAQVASLANVAMNYLVTGDPPRRYGNAHPNIVPYEIFHAQDGYLAVAAANDAQFQRLCAILELPEVASDPDYATNALRVQHRRRLIAILQQAFARHTVSHWLQRLNQAGIACSPVNDVAAVFRDPVVLQRGMRQIARHPTAGDLPLIGPVPKLSRTPAAVRQPPPLRGQHTREVLQHLLGLDDAELAALRRDAVVE